MKQTNLVKLAALALLPAALNLTSCSTPKAGAESSTVTQTRNGALVLDTYQLTAIVTALDVRNRQVQLASPDGRKLAFKATPAVNLRPLHVGSKVTATTTDELALFLAKPVSTRTSDYGPVVPVIARGHESEALSVQTWETTAKIIALDAKTRQLALVFVNGERSVVRAGPKVNLAELSVGDAVSAQIAEALIIALQK